MNWAWKSYLAWREFQTYLFEKKLFILTRQTASGSADMRRVRLRLRDIGSDHLQIYVTPGWWLFPWARPKKITTAVTKSYGRFGNQVLEAACALSFAREIGLPRVAVENPDPFPAGTHSIDGIALISRENLVSRNTTGSLLASFFRSLRPAIQVRGAFFLAWNDNLGKRSPSPSLDTYRELGELLERVESSELLGPTEVVIHVRSGDVFSTPVNRAYGQPPLAYYQVAVLSQEWSKVWVVAQDHHNPVVDALLGWLVDQSIPHEFVSAGFRGDVRLLRRSRNIVASRGTFIPSIAAVSAHPQKIFLFENEVLPVPLDDAVRIIDRCGDFSSQVLQRNWTASAEQLVLLTSYPRECLEFQPANSAK